ncbi:MAG: AAA family ATPase, partial [Chitinivibrionales bacterium]|nr:AAA family ATPase [Chitinivibrionales bacterium]MBD3357109.1 AAA family ATPase [Chitinivibrionales bacterium]
MLKKIKLESYGKFAGKEFPFGPVTIMHGENEAGKSTMFDALLETFSTPSGAGREGRRLKERYGDDRRIEPSFDGKSYSFDSGEFLSLYALRAGDLTIEMDERASWMDRVKARLFSGGIDPKKLSDSLARRADKRGTLKHNRVLSSLEKARDEAEAELRELRVRRDDLLGEEKRVAVVGEELEQLKAKIDEEKSDLRELEERLDFERRIVRRRRMNESLEILDECERLEVEAQQLKHFRTADAKELEEIQRRIGELKTDKKVLERAVEESEKTVERVQEEHNRHLDKRHTTRAKADTAARLTERVSAFLANPPMKMEHTWRIPLVVVGLLALGVGVGVGAVGGNAFLRMAAPALGALSMALLVIVARRTEHIVDQSARDLLLRAVLDEWRESHSEEHGVERDTLEGMQAFLIEKRNAWNELHELLARTENELREAESALRDTRKKFQMCEARLHEVREQEMNWLQSHGVADRDEYVGGIARAHQNAERRSEAQTRLERRLREEECASSGELRRLCDRVLRELDEEGVPKNGMSESEINALTKRIEDKRRDLSRLRERLGALGAEVEGKRGLMKGSLRDLPEKIIQAEASRRQYLR